MSNEEQAQSLLPSAPKTVTLAVTSVVSEPDAEFAETVRRTFEEIGSSSVRIAKSLERLNALAQETYCELDATRRALSLHG
jgi:hypothetical protein